MNRCFKRARGTCCLLLALFLLLQLLSCTAPPPLSDPDTPADQLSDFITREDHGTLTLLGVKDRTKREYRIPEGVQAVDANAFLGCHNAKIISLPASVLSVGEGIFRGCEALAKIEVESKNTVYTARGNALIHKASATLVAGCPATVIPTDGTVKVIGSYAFAALAQIKEITIPNAVIEIGDNAFYGCSALTDLTLSSALLHIGKGAFAKCVRLASLTLPDTLQSVGENAFLGCRSLYTVTLGKEVASIGENAFYGCTKLIEVCNDSPLSVSAGSTRNGAVALYAKNVIALGTPSAIRVQDGFVFYTIPDASLLLAYLGTKKELTLPKSFNGEPYSIYQSAFFASHVTSVQIPSTVTAIGAESFAECAALKRVTLPSSLTAIPQKAFYNAHSLTTLTVPPSVTSVGENAFLGASMLTQEEDGVLYVDTWAVGYQKKTDKLTLRLGTRGIADQAFSSMGSALKEMTLCKGLKYIGVSAFAECTELDLSPLPESLLRIEKNAFLNCRGIQALNLPNGLLSIGDSAFSGCSGIKTLTAEKTQVKLGNRVFLGCRITEITAPAYLIPDLSSEALVRATVTLGDTIPQMAFFDCTSLNTVSLPATLKTVGASAFQGCTALSTVRFGGSRGAWDAITVGLHNNALKTANLICQ